MNNEEITNLIRQKKNVLEKPLREFKDCGQDLRNKLLVVSDNKDNTFSVFMRKNKNLIDATGNMTLCRLFAEDKYVIKNFI